jgi:hypothetical protein
MPTLILTPRMTEDSIALWRAAGRLGWGVERMTRFRPPEDFKIDEPVLYVEALTAPLFAEALGVSVSKPPEDWLPKLPYEYRSRDVQLMPLSEARKLDEPRFIKPPNDKSFRAAVYQNGREVPSDYLDEMAVLVSAVVTWEVEFRCFILDRKIRTFSVYLRNGKVQREVGFPHSDQEEAQLLAFMEKVLADERVDLPRATVVDAGIIAGSGWAVVEQNAAWGSGIYGCDPEQVLEVLRYSLTRNSAS